MPTYDPDIERVLSEVRAAVTPQQLEAALQAWPPDILTACGPRLMQAVQPHLVSAFLWRAVEAEDDQQ